MSLDHLLLGAPFAHRGLWTSGGVAENSLSAFDAACRRGFGIELDVRLSADGEPMVFHDETLERLTAESGVVEERTADELAALRLLGSTDRIPRLADVLSLIAGRVTILVELKTPTGQEGPLERSVAGLLDGYLGSSGVLSFNYEALVCFAKSTTIGIPTGLNCTGHPISLGPSAPSFLSASVDFAADPAIQEWREQIGFALAWTVRSRAQLQSIKGSDRLSGLADNVMFEGFSP